ncbi:transposase [Streptomyces sp. NPDC055692]|uniref:transposase n=1 Tax=Streptomyces sp. NPDC055692 TaxID=3155683 RepID=UPI00342B9E90
MSPGKQASASEAAAPMAAGARLEAMRRRVRLSRVAVWAVIAAGPVALCVAVASAPTTVQAATPAKPTAVRTAAAAADPGGYAQLFLSAWLRSHADDATSAQARLAQSMAPDVELPDPASAAQSTPQSVAAVRSAQRTVDHLTAQIDELDHVIAQTLEEVTAPHDGPAGTGTEPAADGVTARVLAERLDAVPGIGPATAQIILAEIGTDMSRFPTPDHLVSWAKLCPRTIQSGAKNSAGPAGQGNPWLKGALGEAANAAARTDTFLGARYRRIVKRRGHAKALVAVARSILVIAWHLINDPGASYQELAARRPDLRRSGCRWQPPRGA